MQIFLYLFVSISVLKDEVGFFIRAFDIEHCCSLSTALERNGSNVQRLFCELRSKMRLDELSVPPHSLAAVLRVMHQAEADWAIRAIVHQKMRSMSKPGAVQKSKWSVLDEVCWKENL